MAGGALKKRRTERSVKKEERMLRTTFGSVLEEDEEDQVAFVCSELSGLKRHLARLVGRLLKKGTLEVMNNQDGAEVEELEDSVDRWRNMRLPRLQELLMALEPSLQEKEAQVKACLVAQCLYPASPSFRETYPL